MGLLSNIVGAGASSLVKSVADTVDRFVETPDEKTADELKNRLLDLEQAKLADRADERQVEVNKVEAQHSSLWVAGWRPAVGWVCVSGLFYQFVLYPIGFWHFAPPELDTEALYSLLLALLGVGGMRSLEKVKGVARSHMKEK